MCIKIICIIVIIIILLLCVWWIFQKHNFNGGLKTINLNHIHNNTSSTSGDLYECQFDKNNNPIVMSVGDTYAKEYFAYIMKTVFKFDNIYVEQNEQLKGIYKSKDYKNSYDLLDDILNKFYNNPSTQRVILFTFEANEHYEHYHWYKNVISDFKIYCYMRQIYNKYTSKFKHTELTEDNKTIIINAVNDLIEKIESTYGNINAFNNNIESNDPKGQIKQTDIIQMENINTTINKLNQVFKNKSINIPTINIKITKDTILSRKAKSQISSIIQLNIIYEFIQCIKPLIQSIMPDLDISNITYNFKPDNKFFKKINEKFEITESLLNSVLFDLKQIVFVAFNASIYEMGAGNNLQELYGKLFFNFENYEYENQNDSKYIGVHKYMNRFLNNNIYNTLINFNDTLINLNISNKLTYYNIHLKLTELNNVAIKKISPTNLPFDCDYVKIFNIINDLYDSKTLTAEFIKNNECTFYTTKYDYSYGKLYLDFKQKLKNSSSDTIKELIDKLLINKKCSKPDGLAYKVIN